MGDERTFDVCVVGGGPAGAALTLRLAQFGRSVALVEKASFPRAHVGESLTGGVWPLLDVLGLRSAVETHGFLKSEWASVEWAGERRRYRTHGGAGLQVDRGRFDALLLREAAAMPCVRIYQPARIVDYGFIESQWRLRLDSGEIVYAKYLADAAGRGSRLLPGAKTRIGAGTLAVYGYWLGVAIEDGDTLVEAGEGEWYWGAPLPGGEFNATVFADLLLGRSAGSRIDYCDAVLRHSKLIGPKLRNATLLCSSGVRFCDATAMADQAPVTRNWIKVGDAALAIDPLSSQGVQTAIGTAVHAAVVLNTMIERPDDADLAMEFYQSRLRESAEFHGMAAREFYRQQFAVNAGEFWRRRAVEGAAFDAAAAGESARRSSIAQCVGPEACLRVSSLVEFASVAVVDGCYVRRLDGVKSGGRSFAFVGDGMAVAPRLREIDRAMPAIEVVRRWSRSMSGGEAMRMLDWAWMEGLVEVE
jgi:flavin-dependent dehydrogenase